jgi:hypothetical protein
VHKFILLLCAVVFSGAGAAAPAAEIRLFSRPHDPYGSPRPAPKQEQVPLLTSFYFELGTSGSGSSDAVVPESVHIELEPKGRQPFAVLISDRRAAEGYRARFTPGENPQGGAKLVVYVDSERRLLPSTNYTVRVSARSRQGAVLPANAGAWQFTTEAAPRAHPLSFDLSLKSPPVDWHGGFFTGSCGTGFCTSATHRIPTYQLMEQVRRSAPKAWSLQRDFWLTGMEHQPAFLSGNLPNLVRERQTRRIAAIDKHQDGLLLRVEDFFGHRQYGIPSARPVSEDYHPGDEVLIADGVHDARAKVIRADDRQGTVLVTAFATPAGGWKIAYASPPSTKEDPNAPGLFPPGGCYLRKFRPSGTPAYYWGRLDREWDLAHKQFNRRLLPNFADAPGDLAMDGRNWTTAKDYVELHEVTRAIAGHVIERYGPAALDFPWSVFNEPDLIGFFWRSDWNELQKFYDYTVDGILRAFEDHGYDSRRVLVGGLELGGIFGTNLRLREFLSHCSPRAKAPGALPSNAAFADPRLDGKRSKRVEELCKAHGGRGSPCDFISVHAYNRSQLMAEKLIRAKETALEIDAEYYARLWVDSHEACPGWDVPPDPAYGDSYLGNGYFPTWCADVARRQLQRAAVDARYAYGESILTFWAWPSENFEGRNDCVRAIGVDDNGDGKADRTVTVAMPILHFLGLVARMGPQYRVLPERTVGGHVVSGFASQVEDKLYVLLYSHHALDTESRSEVEFDVALNLADLKPGEVRAEEYRFDKDHNSYFRLGRELRDELVQRPQDAAQLARVEEALRQIGSDARSAQLTGLDRLAELGPAAAQAAGPIFRLYEKSQDSAVREKAIGILMRLHAPRAYPASAVRKIEELAALRSTNAASYRVTADGRLQIRVRLAGNGASWITMVRQPDYGRMSPWCRQSAK